MIEEPEMARIHVALPERRSARARSVTLVLLAAAGLFCLRALAPARPKQAAIGFISRVPTPEAHLLAFEVVGTIDKGAIRSMAEQVMAAFDTVGDIDLLILMDRFEGMTAGAALDPANLLSQARSLSNVRKYGVVGAPAMAATMIELFDKVIPVDAKTFEAHEVDAAWDWVRTHDPIAEPADG